MYTIAMAKNKPRSKQKVPSLDKLLRRAVDSDQLEIKNKMVNFRASESERKQMSEVARLLGMSLGNYIRSMHAIVLGQLRERGLYDG